MVIVYILIGLMLVLLIGAFAYIVMSYKPNKPDDPKPTPTSALPPYVSLNVNGYNGIPITFLAQSEEFYKNTENVTMNYLLGVHPTAKESFEKLNHMQLASFYNSLWFYYNCKGNYKDNDLEDLPGTKNDNTTWDALPCSEDYPLPYTPQGWLYNFYTYQKFNVPTIYSDSDENKIYLQLENATSTRPGIMGGYGGRYARSSGIMWFMQRTIHRDVWHPKGLINDKPLDNSSNDNWKVVLDIPPSFNFPNLWYGGLKDNMYIEVTHSPTDTGDALNQSPWWWYNATVGSGLFLNLGKTLAVKNKITGIFTPAKMLSETDSGKQVLQTHFNTTDPYVITWGIVGLCGYDAVNNIQYCNFGVEACGPACDPAPIGYSRAAKYTFQKFFDETVNLQLQQTGTKPDYPSDEYIRLAIDLAIDNQNYNLAHVAEHVLADETIFFLAVNLDLDTVQIYEDPNANDNYVFEIIDCRIPEKYKAAAKNRDYTGFMNISQPDAAPIVNDDKTWSDPGATKGNSYKKEAINEYLKNVYDNNWLTLRDPLDVYNENKVKKCEGVLLSNVCDGKYARNMYCSASPLLNAYKCISPGNEFSDMNCVMKGKNINC